MIKMRLKCKKKLKSGKEIPAKFKLFWIKSSEKICVKNTSKSKKAIKQSTKTIL